MQHFGEWEPLARSWWSQASEEDLNHAARLRIPTSLANVVPLGQGHQWRRQAAKFQYVALITRCSSCWEVCPCQARTLLVGCPSQHDSAHKIPYGEQP